MGPGRRIRRQIERETGVPFGTPGGNCLGTTADPGAIVGLGLWGLLWQSGLIRGATLVGGQATAEARSGRP